MMDGVEIDVEPVNPMMHQMPDEVLEVKQQEVGYDSSCQLQQGRSLVRQVHRWPPYPLSH